MTAGVFNGDKESHRNVWATSLTVTLNRTFSGTICSFKSDQTKAKKKNNNLDASEATVWEKEGKDGGESKTNTDTEQPWKAQNGAQSWK